MTSGDWKAALKAIQDGDIIQLKYYIEKDLDINYEHPEIITTLLIEAVEINNLQVVKLLLENGADPEMKAGIDQMNALERANHLGYNDIAACVKENINRTKKPGFMSNLFAWLKS